MKLARLVLPIATAALFAAGTARAVGIPVIDVTAIAQLIQQLTQLQQQHQTMAQQLSTLRSQHAAMTGGRGMQNLLAGQNRAYLPHDWNEINGVLNNTSSGYSHLASAMQTVRAANAVLSSGQLNQLSPQQRQLVNDGRQAAAMAQVLTRTAYQSASQRVVSLQQLINAIAGAGDAKAILDLQARIQSEQAMLQNDQTKLQSFYQLAYAEEMAQRQRIREQSLSGIGSYRTTAMPNF